MTVAGTTLRGTGRSPREKGTNPRARGTAPRQQRVINGSCQPRLGPPTPAQRDGARRAWERQQNRRPPEWAREYEQRGYGRVLEQHVTSGVLVQYVEAIDAPAVCATCDG